MVDDILRNERISNRRLARSIGVTTTSVWAWRKGRWKPRPAIRLLLVLIKKHGLNAVLSGDLTQSVENQGRDAMQGSDKAK